ncbi:MAG: FAD-dependent oxidoreductase, partial [Candidatus Marinimicrobia bacterium]|nr:FAD-dependent oxidoreductase [Candidatus Neomarinimicrobiota bacterium]
MSQIKTDYLVIGSGIAGLTFALKVAEFGEVSLITKSSLDNTNTVLAQGGIAAVILDNDNTEDHAQDTHIAGAGLCHKDAVDIMVKEASRRIDELAKRGVEFDRKKDGSFDLAREG